VVLIGGLSFHHSSSGFFGQGCQKSLGNAEKDRFNHAEPFILSSLSPSLSENPRIFSEKTFPRIKATGFRGSAETCQLYFQAIYKNKIERIPLYGLSGGAKPLKRLPVLIGM